jgi:hypothetical protein
MKTTALYVMYILIALKSLDCSAQHSIQEKDSSIVSQLSSSFFNWYINSVKTRKQAEYNPVEVQDKLKVWKLLLI